MTPTEKAMEYAKQHLQAVRICWVDRQTEICGAVEAVERCSDRRVSGRIVGAVAQDKELEILLNQLIDSG